MESLSAGGPDWQVFRASGRKAGRGLPPLPARIWMSGMGVSVYVDIMVPLIFCGALFYGISALIP